MPDFGDRRTGEGERKVPPGAVLQRRRKMARLARRRRALFAETNALRRRT